MNKKAFFIETNVDAFDNTKCSKCGLNIKDIQDGKMFWNPNPNAQDKNICRNCYDVWNHQRAEGYKIWQDKHLELTKNKEINMISEKVKSAIVKEVGIKCFNKIKKNVEKEIKERKPTETKEAK